MLGTKSVTGASLADLYERTKEAGVGTNLGQMDNAFIVEDLPDLCADTWRDTSGEQGTGPRVGSSRPAARAWPRARHPRVSPPPAGARGAGTRA